MLRDYYETSLRHRLMLLMLLPAVVALALALLAISVNEALTARQALNAQLTALAQVVGENSTAALSVGDRRTAGKNLSALRAKPDVLFAGIFDAQGKLFASYIGASVDREQGLKKLQYEYQQLPASGKVRGLSPFEGGNWRGIAVALPVTLDGQEIGTILIETGFARLYEVMLRNLAISAALMVAAILIALLFSTRLQRTISGPVLELADMMRRVSAHEAYGTRANSSRKDEIGALFSAFNHMLEQIRLRDQRLAVVNERLNLALGASGIGLWDWDAVEGSIYLDARWAEMIGAPLGESRVTVGELVALMPPEERDAVFAQALLALKGLAPLYDVEHRVRMPSGNWKWVHSRGKVTERDANGRALRMIGTNTDITQRKQDEAKLHSATQAAEAGSRAKSQFLANMSHEIRTPMNGVLGMIELLLNTELNERQLRLAQTVQQSGTALLKIINDVLDFSKIEAGKLELEMIDFDLRRTAEEVVNLFAESAQAKRIELILHVEEAIPPALRGDPGRLRQILTNLIGNAIKFTDQGEVVVRVGLARNGGDHVVVRFEVSDSGIGIEPEAQARIFDAFSQADGSTTRKYGGTGLGLTICKHLAALFRGEIGVASQPGRGSTFWFTAALEKQSGAEPYVPPRPTSLRNLRVLVVDDNAANRDILCDQLAALGMRADSAAGGREALGVLYAAAGRDPYRIGVLDMQMPGMDGVELARLIRCDRGLEGIELVMLSSIGEDVPTQTLRELRVRRWLTKPVNQRQLSDCLVEFTKIETPAFEPLSSPAPAPARSARVLHVLVAEDNPVNQAVATEMLAAVGCTCRLAANGREALEAIAQEHFDVVLMDCQMPEMDGFEATRALREREAATGAPRLPVIALTAHALEGDREQCVAAGMDAYLAKPYGKQQLEQAIRRHAEGQPEEAAAPSAAVADAVNEGLDRGALDNIRALDKSGGSAVLHRLIGIYLKSAPGLVLAMRRAADAGDAPELARAAHSLKSSSLYVGAARLGSLCREIEAAARSTPPSTPAGLVAALVSEYSRIEQLLRAELEKGDR